jgi:hypothetical protein
MDISLEPIYQTNVRVSNSPTLAQLAYLTVNDKKYKISRCVSHKGKFWDEKMYMLFPIEKSAPYGFISIRSDETSIKPIGMMKEFPEEIIGNMGTFDFIMEYIDRNEVWNNMKSKEEYQEENK